MTEYIDPNSSYAEDAESKRSAESDNKKTPGDLRVQAEFLRRQANELEGVIMTQDFLIENKDASPDWGRIGIAGIFENIEPDTKVLETIGDWFNKNWKAHRNDLMAFLEERRRKLEE